MTTITTTIPTNHLSLVQSSWQSAGSTQELIPQNHAALAQASWQSTGSTQEAIPVNHTTEGFGNVLGPNIGVKHRSQDTMQNYTVPTLPNKGPG